jgi:hypothetical protein
VAHHTALRKRESEKDSHGVQGNQAVRLSTEDNDKESSQRTQSEDAVGENQSVAKVGQLPWQIAVTSQDR